MRYKYFTSSEVHRLCGTESVMATYVDEVSKRRRLQKEFVSQGSTATRWGNFMEDHAFGRFYEETKLQIIPCSNRETDFRISPVKDHGGTPDFVSFDGELVGSIKCPFTESAFIDLWDLCKSEDVERFKKEKKEYYWQLVSDLLVTGAKKCVLVVYMPYGDELVSLLTDSELYWLTDAPHINRDTEFSDIIYWFFEPPAEDVQFLKDRLELASNILNSGKKIEKKQKGRKRPTQPATDPQPEDNRPSLI